MFPINHPPNPEAAMLAALCLIAAAVADLNPDQQKEIKGKYIRIVGAGKQTADEAIDALAAEYETDAATVRKIVRPKAKPKPKEKPQPKSAPKPKPPEPRAKPDIGYLGDARVLVSAAGVDRVPLRDLVDDATTSKKPLLMVFIGIKSASEAKKIDYQPWGTKFEILRAQPAASLTDEHGNTYAPVHFGFGTKVVGQIETTTAVYDKPILDVLVFEAPVDAAKTLFLTLPGANVGQKGQFRFEIPAAMLDAYDETVHGRGPRKTSRP